MTQEQYNVIVKTLQVGVPALANELVESINELIVTNKENNEEKSKTEE